MSNSKKVHLITHGERNNGPNPGHTPLGFEQIQGLELPIGITQVGIGTGRRFQEIYDTICNQLPDGTSHFYSPFCGSANGIEPDGQIILVNGKLVDEKNYLNLIRSKSFNAWEFINELANGTLLCAGGELIIALGLKTINQKGHLYKLLPETLTGHMIQ